MVFYVYKRDGRLFSNDDNYCHFNIDILISSKSPLVRLDLYFKLDRLPNIHTDARLFSHGTPVSFNTKHCHYLDLTNGANTR